MSRAGVSSADRTVLGACAALALVAAVLPTVLWRLQVYPEVGNLVVDQWLSTVIGLVPECAALAAVVLTRVRWAGVVIAAGAALVGAVTGLVAFLDQGIELGPLDVVSWFGWPVAFALPLLVADAVAARIEGFTARTGALTGALVGAAAVLLFALSISTALGFGMYGVPAGFWLQTYAAPVVALTLTGALSGAAARTRRRSAQSPTGPAA